MRHRQRHVEREPSFVENKYAVRKAHGFPRVVRDEKDGHVALLEQTHAFVLQRPARQGVERPEGFVHEKQRRIAHQRSRKACPLRHA